VTHFLTNPSRSRRTRGSLASALLVVALAALGCGATEPTDPKPIGLPRMRAAGNLLEGGNGGAAFDVDRPTIRKLDQDLLDALQAAARDAQSDGVTLVVNSGWRSRKHQLRLFTEAVSKYGSEEEALRYVSTPDTSAHVTGDAIDIGPTDAADWLSQHGSDYGLCQIFANEIWHYELATTPGGECPEMLPDSSYRG
jgi:zinc D-Ala-D-Ala carboxypeptidase